MNRSTRLIARCRGGALAALFAIALIGAARPVFAGVPVGIDVGFEELQFPASAFNYDDESFVFANVKGTTVPEPLSLLLLGVGLAGVGYRLRRRER